MSNRDRSGITTVRSTRGELLVRRLRGEQVASNGRCGSVMRRRSGWLVRWWISGRRRRRGSVNPVEQHLMRRSASHRRDTSSPDDLAALVREVSANGRAESTIVIVVRVANRIDRQAARRLGQGATTAVSLLLLLSGRSPGRAPSASCSSNRRASGRPPPLASPSARYSSSRRSLAMVSPS